MKNNKVNLISFFEACLSLFVFACLSLSAILIPDKTYSRTENRMLAEYKNPVYKNLISGEWGRSLEVYSLEQFPLREAALKGFFGMMDITGVRERNGYIDGMNDAILTVNAILTESEMNQEKEKLFQGGFSALKILKEVCDQRGCHLISLQIPHKDEFYANYYPSLYQDGRRNRTICRLYFTEKVASEGFDVLDVGKEIMTHQDEYLYYYIDNHYTSRGAYYTYQSLLEHINDHYGDALEFPEWEECRYIRLKGRVSDGFLRVFGDSGRINRDYVEYVIPYNMPEYERYEDGEKSELPIFDEKKIKYSLFMSGNHANTAVYTGRPELPNILYIGYSYTNALEAMSVYSFNTTYSLDPRYYEGSIKDFILTHDLDYVVVVRNDLRTDNENLISRID